MSDATLPNNILLKPLLPRFPTIIRLTFSCSAWFIIRELTLNVGSSKMHDLNSMFLPFC
jgi:hypothetical protein